MRNTRRIAGAGAALAAIALGLGLSTVAFGGAKSRALVAEVHVTFTSKRIAVTPSTLRSQLATFDVALLIDNKDKKRHVLTIKGPGLGRSATHAGLLRKVVAPHGRATLRLKLLTGAYKLWDPVGIGKTTVRWLVVRPATVPSAEGTTDGGATKPVNPAFPPGETSTNSWMECAI